MRHLTILLIILFLGCSTTKNITRNKVLNYKHYFLGITKADSLLFIGKPKEAYLIYDKLFKKYDSQNGFTTVEYFKYLKSKAQSKIKITKRDLELCFSKHGIKKEAVLSDSLLKMYYERYKLKNSYKNLQKSYLANIDLKLRTQIIKMTERDQFYRVQEYNLAKMRKVDAENEQILKEFFKKDIYPDELIAGNYFDGDEFNGILPLLLHTGDSIRKSFFLPKVKKFIKQGKCPPHTYAFLVDQMYLYADQDQIYGSYSGPSLKKEDFAKYNKNRKELDIGLPSIQYDVWKNNRYN